MNDLTLVIGNKNYSSWSLRPWLFLKQFEIPFEEKMVFFYDDEMVGKLQPYFSNGKVPVLIIIMQITKYFVFGIHSPDELPRTRGVINLCYT